MSVTDPIPVGAIGPAYVLFGCVEIKTDPNASTGLWHVWNRGVYLGQIATDKHGGLFLAALATDWCRLSLGKSSHWCGNLDAAARWLYVEARKRRAEDEACKGSILDVTA